MHIPASLEKKQKHFNNFLLKAPIPVEDRGNPLPLADPGVLESLLGPDPLGGVNRQHLVDQVLGLDVDIYRF